MAEDPSKEQTETVNGFPLNAAHKVGSFLAPLAEGQEYSYLDAIAKATDAAAFLAALNDAIRRVISSSGDEIFIPKKEINAVIDFVIKTKKPSEITKIGSIISADALVEGAYSRKIKEKKE